MANFKVQLKRAFLFAPFWMPEGARLPQMHPKDATDLLRRWIIIKAINYGYGFIRIVICNFLDTFSHKDEI